MWDEHELHILGYWIDPQAESILGHQERGGRRRTVRMAAMIDRLRQLNVNISMSDVEKAAGPSVKTLGRPHLARALFAAGYTRYYSEAFNRYIGDSGPAYVAEGFPTPEDAITTIHAAGGVAVWAHPPIAWFEEGIGLLADWGLDGIECYRPGLLPADVACFEREVRNRELFPTGGSDWHGPQRSTLGDFGLSGDRVAQFLSIGGVYA
jgi:predicted metal-dependent phosphoesterase TrpH